MSKVDHIAGHTWHGRKGDVQNAFRYSIDYVLLDAEADVSSSLAFGRNRFGLFSLRDRDHGGSPKAGRAAEWVREVLSAHNLPRPERIEILAQPRVLGHIFNPVSFWLCYDDQNALRVVISEVSNTYGDRHSYLCMRDDHGPIGPEDRLRSHKIFHVSPFQDVAGGYEYRFDIRPDRLGIFIDHSSGNENGVTATLVGERKPLATSGVLRALLRRPLGSRRVLALIHWQALKLWWKGAAFRSRPEPPSQEVSR